jgi:hypothetical protein
LAFFRPKELFYLGKREAFYNFILASFKVRMRTKCLPYFKYIYGSVKISYFPVLKGNIVAMSLINQHPFAGRAWFSPFNMGWLEGYVLEGRSDYGRFSLPESAFEVTPGRRVV